MCSERLTTTWSARPSAATRPPSYPTSAIVAQAAAPRLSQRLDHVGRAAAGRVAAEGLADHVIVTPSQHIPRIQEAQASAYHVLIELS